MDGYTITLIGGLFASQFFIYYRLGRVEAELRSLKKKLLKDKNTYLK